MTRLTPCSAVGERQQRKVPSGSTLGIRPHVCLLVAPGVELGTRPGLRGDFEARPLAGRYPAVAAERQGGPLDSAVQPSPAQVVMKPFQAADVDGPVVHPDTLHQTGGARRALPQKQGLVGQIQYVAHF